MKPEDIKDEKVRKWFLEKNGTKGRTWIFPVYHGTIDPDTGFNFFKFLVNKIPAPNDKVIFLILIRNVDKEGLRLIPDWLNHEIVYADKEDAEKIFLNLIKQHNVDSFFSHATFNPIVLRFKELLSEPELFDKILSVWFEGGFLRHVCFQFDWMGWNALSSLANIKVSDIPALNSNQILFLDSFMENKFYPQKVLKEGTIFHSENDVKDYFKDDRPISLIALQVETDSVIKNFSDKKYHSSNWAFDFAEKHKDHFFVIKEHPKQIDNVSHNKKCGDKGDNWVYINDKTIDTVSLSRYSNSVIVVNSTVGFEALYWTKVFRGGDSVYSHDEVSFHIDEFGTDRNIKRKDLLKFMYYAITTFHYTPGVNASNRQEWFDKINAFRKSKKGFIQIELKEQDDIKEAYKKLDNLKGKLSDIVKSKNLPISWIKKPEHKNTKYWDSYPPWFRSLLTPTEVYSLFSAIGTKFNNILEIGTATAGTHYIFKQFSNTVISVDASLDKVVINSLLLNELNELHGSHFIWGNSYDDETVQAVKEKLNGLIDFLFIDGEHTTEAVLKDHEKYCGLVKKGGWIAFDDYYARKEVRDGIDIIAKEKNIDMKHIGQITKGHGIAFYQVK